MQIEPTAPGQILAHLHEAHGIVHVGQGLSRFGPVFRQELRHDHEPSEPQHEDNTGRLQLVGRSRCHGNQAYDPIKAACLRFH